MARPSFFGGKKPEVISFIKGLSEEYRVNRGDSLSLKNIVKKLRPALPFVKRLEVAAAAAAKKKAKQKGVKYEEPKDPDAALKLVIYRLCNANNIWFGDPKHMPSRTKTPKAVEKKASR